VDLTKAGDIIRSRIYDAFFLLIAVALVYLAIASILIWDFRIHPQKGISSMIKLLHRPSIHHQIE
jgi:ABC-type arginine/histidine transport system permease subunit